MNLLKNVSFPEPDTLFAYVCSNPIMIIFSVDGHHFAFLYDRA